ncbi:adenylyl-sulfate kinase [Duganella sp. LjRoot269]|jgi:adenylylsulfate kinase|uniref:adenylyl-sulfate kinase n=1 Tax=Duganella sp. LjRoot269 TaxID=3342305 RepID=UPI003354385B
MPRCYWFTGLPGAGKTTLATALHVHFTAARQPSLLLDADALRAGLNRDLGFSRDDRQENVRRIAEVAKVLVANNMNAIVASISPYSEDRLAARALFAEGDFIEIFVSTSIDTCVARDPKGLYALARAGKLRGLSGWDDPYQPPLAAELVIDTATCDVAAALRRIADLS